MTTKLSLSVLFPFIIFFIPTPAATAGSYYFKHITIENGLSQNTVLSILQDSKGFMWFGTKDGLNRYDGNSFKIFKRDTGANSIGNNTIWALLEDNIGRIWIGTDKGIYIYVAEQESFSKFILKSDKGLELNDPVLDLKKDNKGNIWISTSRLYRYNPAKNTLIDLLPTDTESVIKPIPRSIMIDDDEVVWVSMLNGGINRYDEKTIGRPADDFENKRGLTKTHFSEMIGYKNNYIIAGTLNQGLKIIDKTSNEIKRFFNNNKSQLYVRTIKMFDNRLWVGTESGLYIINPDTQEADYIGLDKNNPFSLSDNVIYSMYKDREGGIWIGTYFGGLNYLPKQSDFFEKYYPGARKNTISGRRISGICADKEKNIWIGTEDAGLNKFNPLTNSFEHFNTDNGLSYHNVHDIILDGDNLWIGFFNNGIDVMNLKTGKIKHYDKSKTPNPIENNDVFALYRDSRGNIWVGTSSYAYLYHRESDGFIKQSQIGQHFISDILEDSKGRLWFATYDAGVIRYNPRTDECKQYNYSLFNSGSICFHKITSIFEDSKQRLWFAGESGGISVFNESNDNFTTYGIRQGLVSDMIYKILEDRQGFLWLSSNRGLMKFDPDKMEVIAFNTSNGILSNQFNYKSGFIDERGKIYFGSINGLITFYPDSFIQNDYIPPVVITQFKLFDKTGVYPPDNINNSNQIILKHNQSSFSIDFASLSYSAPELNKYAYRMKGLNNDWVYLDKAQQLIFSNLPHGRYVFEIKASNNDGVWNEIGTSIDIIIKPPFSRTTFAYSIYLLLISSLVIYVYHLNVKRIKSQTESDKIIFEKEKEKEIYNAKIDFFTNIAHEIRTPLTLIQSPLENIINNSEDKGIESDLQVMKKNTHRLLLLINQLLDFRRIEEDTFSLTFVRTDIAEIFSETFLRFTSAAKQRNLSFELQSPDYPILVDVDKEAITKVLSNLISNGIKYSSSKVVISFALSEEQLYIRVNSDGDIILPEFNKKIFEPFFQISDQHNRRLKSGSGIGLAIAKSLVELHKGTIELDRNVSDMNSFLVRIPVNQPNKIIMTDGFSEKDISHIHVSSRKKFTNKRGDIILVVEDDEDLQMFISEKLAKHYQVITAKNGAEALALVEQEPLSLIISDVMMPIMNGIELCKKLKHDNDYCHIPFVMLTAKTTTQNKIEGLEAGADAYIEKPFSFGMLYAQISNLLANRKKMRDAFASMPLVKADTIAMNKSDEIFLKKVTDVILDNIADSEFKVEQLADVLSMSRSSLLRKISGISGFTPNEFIKIVRLKRAAEMLQDGIYNVNEVCYLTGFSYPSYFSKSFFKQFGVLPKDFIKN